VRRALQLASRYVVDTSLFLCLMIGCHCPRLQVKFFQLLLLQRWHLDADAFALWLAEFVEQTERIVF